MSEPPIAPGAPGVDRRAKRFRIERRPQAHDQGRPRVERRSATPPTHHAMYGRRRNDRLVLPQHPVAHLCVKRVLDVVLAVTVLILCAPVMAIAAFAVRCTTPGPVFFRQTRVGKHHRRFTVIKFRTMTHGAYDDLENDDERWAAHAANGYKHLATGSSVTRVGRVLRITSIDELPQLWNVLRGDMSIVGIRPLLPRELGERPNSSQGLYGVLRPGLTGRWQVSGRSLTTATERIRLDDEYIQQWSLRSDLELVARTPAAIVRAEGAR